MSSFQRRWGDVSQHRVRCRFARPDPVSRTSGRSPRCRGATGGRYDLRLPSCSAHSRLTRRSPVPTANTTTGCARSPLRSVATTRRSAAGCAPSRRTGCRSARPDPVCTTNDPWCPPETSRRIGEATGIPIDWIEQAGHINTDAGRRGAGARRVRAPGRGGLTSAQFTTRYRMRVTAGDSLTLVASSLRKPGRVVHRHSSPRPTWRARLTAAEMTAGKP